MVHGGFQSPPRLRATDDSDKELVNICAACQKLKMCCDTVDGGCFNCSEAAFARQSLAMNRHRMRRQRRLMGSGMMSPSTSSRVDRSALVAAQQWAFSARQQQHSAYVAGWRDGGRGLYRPSGPREAYEAGWRDGSRTWARAAF